MKTGLIHGSPNKPVKKQYYYHGILRDCFIQPKPPPFDELVNIPGEYFVLTFDYSNVQQNSVELEGVLIFAEGLEKITRRGFEYGVTTGYGSDVHEEGSFSAGNYVLTAIF